MVLEVQLVLLLLVIASVLVINNNGVLIQFGLLQKGSGWETATKTLPLSYSNTNYALVLQGITIDVSQNNLLVPYGNNFYGACDNKTVSSFNHRADAKGSFITIGY